MLPSRSDNAPRAQRDPPHARSSPRWCGRFSAMALPGCRSPATPAGPRCSSRSSCRAPAPGAGPRAPSERGAHEGHEWLYVIAGRLRQAERNGARNAQKWPEQPGSRCFLPRKASCIAEFQDECAEEECAAVQSATTPRPCQGVSGRPFTPMVAWASRRAGGRSARCRARGGLEMTFAASGNRYSSPSTRPMAAAGSRTVAARPRLRAMSVRYRQHGGGPQVGGRGEGCVSVRGGEAVAGQDQPPGERGACDRQRCGGEHRGGEHCGLGEEPGQPSGHQDQRQFDHPGAVLVADGHTPATAATAWAG